MNTQAILKLIDEKIWENEFWNWIDYSEDYCNALKDLKKEISSLPSLDIDSLQRYTNTTDDWMEVSPNWYWVAFKDVYDLLGR